MGISFFTFQAMSYAIDVYRDKVRPARCFMEFACYVALFPQLIAGPIVRYADIRQEFENPRLSWNRTRLGAQFFILGMAKKVILADTLSGLANAVFDAGSLAGFNSWDMAAAATAYSLQIYFDFSGYTDMAVGIGMALGFTFPRNFLSPYKSASITEFWKRWHISLSSWLKDYLYIPLGGNRRGKGRTYINLGLTMLLGGLWHGASWNFVIWGGYHGVLLALERSLGEKNPLLHLPRPAQVAVCFILVTIGWVFFRATSLDQALHILHGFFKFIFNGKHLLEFSYHRLEYIMLVAGLVIVFAGRNTWEINHEASWKRSVALGGLAAATLMFLFGTINHPFLYFQF